MQTVIVLHNVDCVHCIVGHFHACAALSKKSAWCRTAPTITALSLSHSLKLTLKLIEQFQCCCSLTTWVHPCIYSVSVVVVFSWLQPVDFLDVQVYPAQWAHRCNVVHTKHLVNSVVGHFPRWRLHLYTHCIILYKCITNSKHMTWLHNTYVVCHEDSDITQCMQHCKEQSLCLDPEYVKVVE